MLNKGHLSPRAGTLAMALALAALPLALAQRSELQSGPAITLVKSTPAENAPLRQAAMRAGGEDYRQFAKTKVGKSSEPEVFTLSFHATTKVTGISASNDFHVSGGTCIEGHTYSAGDVCSVEATFTPQGPGHRTGKLVIRHSASAQPMVVPSGGEAIGPAVSFIPAAIETVPSTKKNGTGVLVDAQGLAIDGGDNLYIADTGNDVVWYQDSSGQLQALAGINKSAGVDTGLKLSSPYGVAVASDGGVLISDSGDGLVVGEFFTGGFGTEIGGGKSSTCTYKAPCDPGDAAISAPLGIAIDSANNLFVNTAEFAFGSAGTPVGETPYELSSNDNFFELYNYYGQFTTTFPVAVDANDDLYLTAEILPDVFGNPASDCYIVAQNEADGIGGKNEKFWVVAGTQNCGFSGDGGLALGAEISTSIQGFAFDAAGNFYFTDTGNNRVRRIDALTGIIRTVGGNGEAAYHGNGGPSTLAAIDAPTGVGVDSRGNVYAIGTQEVVTVPVQPSAVEETARPKAAAPKSESIGVVREFGAMGALAFAAQKVATSSAVQTILVSNVGNAALNLIHAGFNAGDTGDFAIDPNTTSCTFTTPLASGENCVIGIVFTPSAAGARSATLTVADNTVTGSSLIQLSGTGVEPSVVKLSPKTLELSVARMGTSAAETVELENTGKTSLSIKSFDLTGPGAADFSESHACGETLEAGDKCSVEVKFDPAAEGSRFATLSVETSAGTASLPVKGTTE